MTTIRAQNDAVFHRQMERLAAARDRRSKQLASGKRIATAADDPTGLAVSARLTAAVRSAAVGERNLADGQSLARTAEAALQTQQDTLGRMRELSIQARNGTVSAEDRATIQQEFDQLSAQLDQTAGSASFGGRTLLDGSASGGGAIAVTDGSAGGEHVLDLPDMRALASGVAGRAVAADDTLAALDAASARVAAQRGALGGADQALERHGRQLGAAAEAAEASRSRIEDADFAQLVAERTRDRILLQLQLSGQRHGRGVHRRLLDLVG